VDEKTPDQPYTIHEDVDRVGAVDTADDDAATDPARRSGPDPLALVAGLTAIVIAVLALTGSLAAVDPRWVLAIAAVGVGCAVLVVTLRRRS
jgi:fatty acid desaturase